MRISNRNIALEREDSRFFEEAARGLVLLVKDSKSGGCPAVYATGRGSYVVQGDELADSAALAGVGQISPAGAYVEVPERLLRGLFHLGVERDASSRSSKDDSAVQLTLLVTDRDANGSSAVYASGRGSYVVQGMRVTDTGELADLVDVLPGEAFVEVPERLLQSVFQLERA